MAFIAMGSKTFFEQNGVLMARGIAFSLLVTAIPVLFISLYIASAILADTTIINTVFQRYLNDFLPAQYSEVLFSQTIAIIQSESWRNIGVVGMIIMVITPQSLFSSIEVALKRVMDPPHNRTFMVRQIALIISHFSIILIIFSFAFLTMTLSALPDKLITSLPSSLSGLQVAIELLSSKGVILVILTLIFASIYRMSYHHALKKRFLFGVSFVLAIIWQILNALGTQIIGASGRREVMYGIMAGAVVLMMWAYLFSVILIIGGIIIAQLEKLYLIKKSTPSMVNRRWFNHRKRTPSN